MQIPKNGIYHKSRICPEDRGSEIHTVGIMTSLDWRHTTVSAEKLRERCLTFDFFFFFSMREERC